jgi:hypothetical protein
MKRIVFVFTITAATILGAGNDTYEVWAIDQSDSPNKTFGGTIYIWNGHDLENTHGRAAPVPEKIDLAGAASSLCFANTGANPGRPHMIFFNAAQTHAIVSFVASGHVLIINAATRAPAACLRASPGAGGARQAHAAVPAPDGTYIVVANQNGKLLERINSNYATNTFTLDAAAQINLATCITGSGALCQDPVLRPDNAPICPLIDSTSRYSFVTLRGGGLFVVDSKATFMTIAGEYDRATVHPNGCGGVEAAGRMFIDSGGGTGGNLHEADLYAFPLAGYSTANPANMPARALMY